MDPTMPCTSSGGIPHMRGGPGHWWLASGGGGGSGGLPCAHSNVQRPPGRGLQLDSQSMPGKRAVLGTFKTCHGDSPPDPVGRNGFLDSAPFPDYLEGVRGGRGKPGVMLQAIAIRTHWKWRKGVLHPFESGIRSCGGPPLVQSEVDVGHARPPERYAVGSSPPIRESSMQYGVLSMQTAGCGMGRGGPPWREVRCREVDVGHTSPPERHAVGRSGPIRECRMQYGVCHMQTAKRGRAQPSCLIECHRAVRSGVSISAVGPPRIPVSTVGRTLSSTTAPRTPWLALRHREVDGGDRRGDDHSLRSASWHGCTPPIGYDRAREWMVHVRGDCWSSSRQQIGTRSRVRNRASTTRSCTSDAEHEFSRTCIPGRFPMLLLRDTRGPQLLLMRTASTGKGVVGQSQLYEASS